jgi:phosphate-selective porin OprO/OprP
MKANGFLLAAFLGGILGISIRPVRAQDQPAAATNGLSPAEELNVLRHRVDELERLVRQLQLREIVTNQDHAQPRVQELEQKVNLLEMERDSDKAAAEANAKESPKIVVGAEGFALSSAKGDFNLQLRGLLQVDSRTFFHDTGIVGNDTFLIRRLRPIIQGTVFRDFDFLFVPDFGGSTGPQLFDAFINYRYHPALQLQAGKYKPPVGLEMLQPDQYTMFNERALPTQLVPNRDVGIMLHGDLLAGTFSYAAGLFNGVGDSRISSNVDFEDDKEFAGRVILQPFKTAPLPGLRGFGFGVSGSYASLQRTNIAGLPSTTGGVLTGYASDGQQQFFAYNPSTGLVAADGEHWRLSPQGFYFFGPFGFLGEYVISDQRVTRIAAAPTTSARLRHTAWEVSGSWMITGETYAYGGGVIPENVFNPLEGTWGAWQLVARYAELDIDPDAFPLFSDPNTSAHRAESWSAGLNWYLNRNFCIKSSFSHTHFRGGGGTGLLPPASVTRRDENLLFTRMQLYF